MITMDRSDHIRLRRLVSRAFTPRVIRAFEQRYRSMAQKVVTGAVAKGRFDLVEEVAVDLPAYAICTLLGVPDGQRRQVVEWTNTLVSQDAEYSFDGRTPEDAMVKLGDYALELAELRRRESGADVVSGFGSQDRHRRSVDRRVHRDGLPVGRQ